jgi:hypothetical protein
MIDALVYGVQFAVSILGITGATIAMFLVVLWFMKE